MRTAFINQLIEEARKDPAIFLLTGDLGFSVLEPFANEFKDRYINVGVAEQNMTGIAAGLALDGYNVFTYSIGNFPTLRCIEQIRYDVCYHNLNVKIIAVGGGYAYASLGASHHATEEIGMLRTIPNLVVCAPGDPLETRSVTSLLAQTKGPGYIRLGKAGEPAVHSALGPISMGQAVKVLDGKETVILSTGAMLKYCFDFIKSHQLKYALYSFPFIKPLDSATIAYLAENFKAIITIEEHQKSAGFGSAVLECLNDLRDTGKVVKNPAIKRIAIPDKFIDVAGTQDYLRDIAGLTLNFL